MFKRTPWQIQKSVIYALFLREVNVRFSAGKLGYFWVIFEPLMQISIFVVVKMMIFGNNSALDYPVFITLGFISFNLFRHIVDRAMSAFKANKGLYAYKQVKPIDALIARILTEILVSTVIIVIFMAVGFYFDFDMDVKNLAMVIVSFLWLIIFALGFGLFVSVIGFFYDSFQKVVKLVLSPIMFISSVFYSMQDMPQALQELLYYNPLAHFMEMLHGSYFHLLDDSFVDYKYIFILTVIPMFFGLLFYKKFEKGIIST